MVRMPRDLSKKTRTIHHPDWDPAETVTIRTYVGDYDRRRILSAASEYRQDEGGKTIIVGTLEKLHLTKRLVALVSWTLQDEDGNPLPFTEDVIRDLPTDVANYIDAEIDKEIATAQIFPSRREAEDAEREERDERVTFSGPINGHAEREPALLEDHERARERAGRGRRPAAPQA